MCVMKNVLGTGVLRQSRKIVPQKSCPEQQGVAEVYLLLRFYPFLLSDGGSKGNSLAAR
jgi:hypothetical protein